MTIWLRILPYIAAVLLAIGGLYWAYCHGVSVTDATWRAEWAARDTLDAQAKAVAEKAARDLEQKYQREAEKVQSDATQKLEQLQADAAGANSAADGLRHKVQRLLATGNFSCNTRAVAGGTTSKNPGDLLAILLDKSVKRNRDLAEIADTAIARGRACEAQYSAMRSSERRMGGAEILPSSRPN